MVVGRNVDEIKDIWQTAVTSTYWCPAVDVNNAMAAIDGALWDILGKRAGTRMFTNANTASLQELEDSIREGMERGYQHFRFRGVKGPNSPVTEMNAQATTAAA